MFYTRRVKEVEGKSAGRYGDFCWRACKLNVLSQSETEIADDGLKRQGSFRKLLPASTNGESQLSMSIKMIDRPNVPQNTKEYIVFLQEYNILSE